MRLFRLELPFVPSQGKKGDRSRPPFLIQLSLLLHDPLDRLNGILLVAEGVEPEQLPAEPLIGSRHHFFTRKKAPTTAATAPPI